MPTNKYYDEVTTAACFTSKQCHCDPFKVVVTGALVAAMLKSIIISSLFLVQSTLGAQFTNPLKTKDGSDPWITFYDGYYYLTTTTWNDVQLTRAKTLEGLKKGQRKRIFSAPGTNRCCHVWAPGAVIFD